MWRTFKNPNMSINIKWCGKDFYDSTNKKMRISTIANLCYFGKLRELQMLSTINSSQFFDEIINRERHDIDESDLYKNILTKSPFVMTINFGNFEITKWIIHNIILLKKKNISFALENRAKTMILTLLNNNQINILKYILDNGNPPEPPNNIQKCIFFLIDICTHFYNSKCSEIIRYMENSDKKTFRETMKYVIRKNNN